MLWRAIRWNDLQVVSIVFERVSVMGHAMSILILSYEEQTSELLAFLC